MLIKTDNKDDALLYTSTRTHTHTHNTYSEIQATAVVKNKMRLQHATTPGTNMLMYMQILAVDARCTTFLGELHVYALHSVSGVNLVVAFSAGSGAGAGGH